MTLTFPSSTVRENTAGPTAIPIPTGRSISAALSPERQCRLEREDGVNDA
jgi:hypothetical protein